MRKSSLNCSVYVKKKKTQTKHIVLLTLNIADKNDELLGEKRTRIPLGNNFIFKTLSNRCSNDRKASRKGIEKLQVISH